MSTVRETVDPNEDGATMRARDSRATAPAPSKRAKRRLDAKAQAAFCDLTAAGMSCAAACRELGFSRDTPYHVRETDAAFAAAWLEARETGADYLEDVAYRLASEGGEDVEYDGAGNVRRRTKRAPNPAILARVLAAWRPERWSDRPQVAVGFQFNTVTHEAGLGIADLDDVLSRAKGLDPSSFLGRIAASATQQRALPAGEDTEREELEP